MFTENIVLKILYNFFFVKEVNVRRYVIQSLTVYFVGLFITSASL